jgi:predicted flap endonuclease-1-like 5' DNA nuclease
MNYRVMEIEGIGQAYAAKLVGAGITTTGALLARGAKPAARKHLAAECSISLKLILKWCNLADLMRINGIGKQSAELLEAAGVDTVKELRKRRPDHLAEKMAAVNAKKNLCWVTPGKVRISGWVEQARTLPPVIKY